MQKQRFRSDYRGGTFLTILCRSNPEGLLKAPAEMLGILIAAAGSNGLHGLIGVLQKSFGPFHPDPGEQFPEGLAGLIPNVFRNIGG